MRAILVMLSVFFGVLTSTQSTQAACAKPSFTQNQLRAIPVKNINQHVFSDALLHSVNYLRCKHNRGKLTNVAQLTSIAAGHSKWMARKAKLSHTSNAVGQRTLKARAKSTGLKYRISAENIAAYSRFNLPSGNFGIANASRCQFRTKSGSMIQPHTYASLALAVAGSWMASSGHRKNLLNTRISYIGAGVAFDPSRPYCGRFFITQNYMG